MKLRGSVLIEIAAEPNISVRRPRVPQSRGDFAPAGGGRYFPSVLNNCPIKASGVKSPALWGTRGRLVEMFSLAAISIEAEPRNFNFRYLSADHFLDVFRTYYGPMLKAFAALDEAKQSDLKDDLHALIARMNKAGDGTMVVPSEYLEVVITKR